jgi:hypothetical protein
VRRTYNVRHNDEGEAQRRKWTFYETINIEEKPLLSSAISAIKKPLAESER